jgi:ABC-type uncharacterized transport system permease subunit
VEIINRREQVNIRDAHTVLTRVLLACGVLVAPLFFAVALVEILIRPAFDCLFRRIRSAGLSHFFK